LIGSLRLAISALRRVAANPDIRRAETAWMLSYAAEWAWLVALFVYAYGVGGVATVGLAGLVRTLPAGILAPALSSLADRLPRHRVLLGIHAGRGSLVGLAAINLAVGGPPWVVFVIAALEGLLGVLHRPTYMTLMPSLARAPEELVASNAASGTMEGIGTLVGPAVGGILIALAAPWATFAVPSATFFVAAAIVLGIRPAQQLLATPAAERGWSVMAGGIRAMIQYPHAGWLLGLFGAQIFVRGLLNVLLVGASVQLLGLGEEGVGLLTAAMGAGGFVGALLAMTLVGRARVAPFFTMGLILWGTPILIIGLLPNAGLAVLVLVVLGVGNAILDVAGFTLLQRTVPNAVRGRVFGMLESIVMLGLAAGSVVAPVMVNVLGLQGALIAAGVVLPAAAVLTWPLVRRTDDLAVIPAREMAVLRGVPMLHFLPLTVLEQIAEAAHPARFAAGSPIIRQGDAGDSFYVLAEGSAAASVDGHTVRHMQAGDSFGEIALLENVPRTATVTAETDAEAYLIDRAAFVCAVTGDRQSLAAAQDVIGERLAAESVE
jgi:MFS family permease